MKIPRWLLRTAREAINTTIAKFLVAILAVIGASGSINNPPGL